MLIRIKNIKSPNKRHAEISKCTLGLQLVILRYVTYTLFFSSRENQILKCYFIF